MLKIACLGVFSCPLYNIYMAKRRRLWGRIVLSYVFLFVLMLYGSLLISNMVLSDTGAYYKRLAEELKDVAPPTIEVRGGESLVLAIGDVMEEPGITVFDDSSMPTLEVDSNVDMTKEGDYRVQYTATDDAGNVSIVERKIKVINPAGRIYLTFDDGPSEYTSKLLDILQKYGVKATFFVTGYGDDAIIKREYDDGHTVGLHTMTHDYGYLYANLGNYWSDLSAVQDRVKRITGESSNIIRFPGGSSNLISAYYDGGSEIMSTLVSQVSERGYKYFDWNIDSNDAGGADSADEVYSNVVNGLQSGGEYVILQHDVKPFSVDAVERIIQYGQENGFVFSRLRFNSFDAHHTVNN
jgi:peptidoglycan/xylan/chitin deacetylase (PgdA/CDA1 family)